MNPRIAFAGSSGTGKTSLAQWVAEHLGIPMNPVGSRSVSQAMGFASPYDVNAAGKRGEFQRRLIAEKVAWEAAHESFVTDRTTFDNIAYTALHDVHSIDAELMRAAEVGADRYSLIVICPMRVFFNPGNDPARVKDRTYHELFEALVLGLIREHSVVSRHHMMECTKLSSRQIELDNIFGSYKERG